MKNIFWFYLKQPVLSLRYLKPGEKFEFPLLMHEINVLPIELSWLYTLFKEC